MSKKMKLNEEQQRFVDGLENNILVSASAGSGKTSTMISKLLSLILRGVSVNEILVLTFTDAAAGEMKQKLYTSLINLSAELENKLEPETNAYEKEKINNHLKNIYESVENITYADIGTFHSTFKKIITKHFYHLELDPAFTLLNAQEQDILLMQSLNDVFDNYILGKDQDFYNLQEVFNKNRRDAAFKDIVLNMFYMSQEKPDFDEWFNNAINENFTTNLKENKITKYLLNYHKKNLVKHANSVAFQHNFAKDNNWTAIEKYLNAIEVLINSVNNCNTFEEFFKLITEFRYDGQRRFPRDLDPEFFDVKDEIIATTESFKEAMKNSKSDLVFKNINSLNESFELSEKYLTKLKEVLNKLIKIYSAKKAAHSQLDFNDLQLYMLKLLEINEVKKEIQNQYKHIFVDEFQDVNEMQNTILQLITNGKNLNMIGDVKQSIYEFRLASPAIFINKINEFDSDAKSGAVIEFNKNYRSSKNILEFVNTVFNKIITKETVGVDYEKRHQLVAGNKSLVEFDELLKQKSINNVSLTIINTAKPDAEESDNLSEGNNNYQHQNKDRNLTPEEVEANVVVKEINSMLGKPYYNSKSNRQEFINYKDIAILTRSGGTFIAQLQKTLNRYKIPSVLSVKSKIFNTYEVSVIFSYLKLLSNHLDDYSLATVMLSKIGDFSHNELAEIRLKNNSKKVPFYECVAEYANNSENNNSIEKQPNEAERDKYLVNKINSFLGQLKQFRESLQTQSVYDVVVDVLNAFDLFNYFKSMPDGEFKVNNINEFLKLLNVDLLKNNITYIVDYLTQLSEKDDFNVSLPAVANSVTILTMHKSKGLEFPAVILADLGKKFNENIKRQDIAISQNLGVGIKLKNPTTRVSNNTLQFNAVVNDKLESELRENIRLFYVATTRAKNYLSLVGRFNAKDILPAMNKPTLQTSNFLELLFVAFKDKSQTIKNYLQNEDFNAEYVVNENKKDEFLLRFVGDDFNLSDDSEQGKIIKIEQSQNEDVINKLNDMFGFKYQRLDSVAIKNSVTGLLQESDYVYRNEHSKTLKTNEINVDSGFSLELGIAYHTIMQKIDYQKHNKTDIENIISGVVLKSSNPQKMQASIKTSQIVKAVNCIKNLIKNGYLNILKEQQFILQDHYNNLIENSNITQKVLVQGVIDLIVEFNDHVILIDFKTNKGLSEQSFKNMYGLQLSLYEKASQHVYKNKPIKKYIYSFELENLIIL